MKTTRDKQYTEAQLKAHQCVQDRILRPSQCLRRVHVLRVDGLDKGQDNNSTTTRQKMESDYIRITPIRCSINTLEQQMFDNNSAKP